MLLNVEQGNAAVQMRVAAGDTALPAGSGARLFHDWGLGLPVSIGRLGDLWSVSGGPARRKAIGGWGGRIEGDVLTALAVEAAGGTRREIAVALWGEDAVAREYYTPTAGCKPG